MSAAIINFAQRREQARVRKLLKIGVEGFYEWRGADLWISTRSGSRCWLRDCQPPLARRALTLFAGLELALGENFCESITEIDIDDIADTAIHVTFDPEAAEYFTRKSWPDEFDSEIVVGDSMLCVDLAGYGSWEKVA